MSYPVDDLAKQTQSAVNAMIRQECLNQSWRLWRKIAESVIEREIGTDWDYLTVQSYSSPPEVILTQYRA